MIDGEVDSARVVTSKKVVETMKDGTSVTKKIWVPLDLPNPSSSNMEMPVDVSGLEFESEPMDIPSPQPERKTYQVNP